MTDIRHRKNGSSKKARKRNIRFKAPKGPGHDAYFGTNPPFWSGRKQGTVSTPSR